MTTYTKAKDIYTQRRTSNNDEFEEYSLIVQPSSVVVTDNQNNLTFIPLSVFTLTASLDAATAISSSHANRADLANDAQHATSADFALVATSATTAYSAITATSASYVFQSKTSIQSDTASLALLSNTASYVALAESAKGYAGKYSYLLSVPFVTEYIAVLGRPSATCNLIITVETIDGGSSTATYIFDYNTNQLSTGIIHPLVSVPQPEVRLEYNQDVGGYLCFRNNGGGPFTIKGTIIVVGPENVTFDLSDVGTEILDIQFQTSLNFPSSLISQNNQVVNLYGTASVQGGLNVGGIISASRFTGTSSYADNATSTISSSHSLASNTSLFATDYYGRVNLIRNIAISDATEFGHSDISIGGQAQSFLITVQYNDVDEDSIAKVYLVSSKAPDANFEDGVWKQVEPISSTGNTSNIDGILGFELDVVSQTATDAFRFRIRAIAPDWNFNNVQISVISLSPNTNFVSTNIVGTYPSAPTSYWNTAFTKQEHGLFSVNGAMNVLGPITGTISYALLADTASFAISSSFITNQVSQSIVSSSFASSSYYAVTASWATSSLTSSYLLPGLYRVTSSWSQWSQDSLNSVTASYAKSSSWAESLTGTSYNISCSWASRSLSSSYVQSLLVQPITSSWALTSSLSSTASYVKSLLVQPITSSWALTSSLSSTASYVKSLIEQPITSSRAVTSSYSLSGSYAITASYALNGGGLSIPSVSMSFYQLPVHSAKLPTASFAQINAGNTNWELLFDITSSAAWQFRMPSDYGGNLRNTFHIYTTSSVGEGAVIDGWEISMSVSRYGDHYTGSVYATSSYFAPTVDTATSWSQNLIKDRTFENFPFANDIQAGDFIVYKLTRMQTGSLAWQAPRVPGEIAVVSNCLEWTKV